MCGIYGIWHRHGNRVDVAALERATNYLRHRGPDDEGYLLMDTRTASDVLARGRDTVGALDLPNIHEYTQEAVDLAFGFRRLAILDLSPAGHQPMSCRDRRFWLVFNGEIYNYRELRSELIPKGYTFQSETDTEVILAAYAEWGIDCLRRFNGMWALALWDSNSRSLLLSRDRFGVKPLYFTDDGGTFAFASEIKALVGDHGTRFAPDDEQVYRYLVYGTLPSPTARRTFFQNVQAMPPGHWMRVCRDGAESGRYWSLPAPQEAVEVPPEEAVSRFAELFTDSVRLRLISDVPVGTCLSGGLDSSSIASTVSRLISADHAAAAQVGDRQKTFSAVYESSERYNEKPFVDLVVRSTGADGNFTFPSYDRLDQDLERLVWHQDQPFQSTSIFAQWCVMSLVRERGVTVLLDGQGADELLAGYRPYGAFLSDLVRRWQLRALFSEARDAQDRTGMDAARLLAAGFVYFSVSALRPYMPPSWLQAVRRARSRPGPAETVLRPEFAAQQRASLPPPVPRDGNGFLDAILREGLTETSLPHLLHYEDRNSMAFGVEARVPFLDYRLVEFVLTRGFPYRIREGWTKWIQREAMRDVVPPAIAWRRDKVGFETPEVAWTCKWLDAHPEFFTHTALSSRYADMAAVNRELRSWRKRGGNTADVRRIWRWINLELWLRAWNRPPSGIDRLYDAARNRTNTAWSSDF